MSESISPALVAEIEQALAQVAEIRAARVVSSDEGFIQEIHVLASPEKTPKQIVRDVESTIMAQFGIAIDHRMISIAQLGREATVTDSRDRGRARICSVSAEVMGVRASARVSLDFDDEVYFGTAEGPASTTGRRRLVAQATLAAVEQYASGSYGFALEDVAIIALGRERVAVSCVTIVTPLGEQSFSGTALARQGENESIVRATLDAINRRLNFLTSS
ncbi:MAG: hypothetical protein Q7W30_05295 [Coriobacteriia bacterium]|nr:hypothetical protein [Coriobacteriia bacterium]